MIILAEDILAEFLQDQNNLTDPNSSRAAAHTPATETFSGDDSETEFSLSTANILYVDSVSVGGSPVTKWLEYRIDCRKGLIKFINAPVTGTDNISVTYVTGTRWVYSDKPHPKLTAESYPRISIQSIDESGDSIGFDWVNTVDYTYMTGTFQLTIWTLLKEPYTIDSGTLTDNTFLNKLMYIIDRLFSNKWRGSIYPAKFDYRKVNELPPVRDFTSNVWQKVMRFNLKEVRYDSPS